MNNEVYYPGAAAPPSYMRKGGCTRLGVYSEHKYSLPSPNCHSLHNVNTATKLNSAFFGQEVGNTLSRYQKEFVLIALLYTIMDILNIIYSAILLTPP